MLLLMVGATQNGGEGAPDNTGGGASGGIDEESGGGHSNTGGGAGGGMDEGSSGGGGGGQLPKRRLKKKTVSTLKLSADDLNRVIDKLMCSMTTRFDKTKCDCPHSCEYKYYIKSLSQAPWPHPSYQMAFYNTYINGTGIDTALGLAADIQAQRKNPPSGDFNDPLDIDAIKQNFLQLNIFFGDQMYTEVLDQPSISVSVLLATIGGALNLWIGITIMTLVEFVELMYNLFVLARTTGVLPSPDMSPNRERTQSSGMTPVEPFKKDTSW